MVSNSAKLFCEQQDGRLEAKLEDVLIVLAIWLWSGLEKLQRNVVDFAEEIVTEILGLAVVVEVIKIRGRLGIRRGQGWIGRICIADEA